MSTDLVDDDAQTGADEQGAPAGADAGPSRPGEHLRTLAAKPRPDVLSSEDQYSDARGAVAEGDGTGATEEEFAAVTEWLLSDTQEVLTRKLRLRIGGTDKQPKVDSWIVRAIPIDVIRLAEREGQGNREQRRSGNDEYDELKANVRVVVEGTVMPDLKALAQQVGLADAAILVDRRFKYKPGLIAQIAAEVMSVSGFDTDDVRAAGNS